MTVGARMNYRRMGRWGLKLSEISLGAWLTFGDDVDEKTAERMLDLAYDKGINFFDNADVYQGGRAEEVMGAAMRGLPRTALVVSSKVFWRTLPGPNGQGLSRKHILESCHASLRRLGTDYLDLYFCHRFDGETPLVDRVGIGLVTWSPLRSGLLSGKYNVGPASKARLRRKEYSWLGDILTEANLTVARGLAEVAGDLGCTPAQLAIGWLLRTSQVTSVITGATSTAQLEENLGAAEVPSRLTPDVLSRIESP